MKACVLEGIGQLKYKDVQVIFQEYLQQEHIISQLFRDMSSADRL